MENSYRAMLIFLVAGTVIALAMWAGGIAIELVSVVGGLLAVCVGLVYIDREERRRMIAEGLIDP